MRKLVLIILISICVAGINAASDDKQTQKNTATPGKGDFRNLLRDNRVFDLAVGKKENRFYFATEEGLKVFEGGILKRVYSKSDGLESEVVSCLKMSGDVLYGTTFSLAERSCFFRLKDEKLTVWSERKGAPVNIICVDIISDQYILMATFNSGFFIFEQATGEFHKVKSEELRGKALVDMIKQDDDVYLATNRSGVVGLMDLNQESLDAWFKDENDKQKKLVPVEKKITEHTSDLQSNIVTCLGVYEDVMWIGTQGGVSKHGVIKNTWDSYWGDTLVSNFVTCVAQDEDYVWFGTQEGVTVMHTVSERYKSITRRSGLPNERILKIRFSKSFIWLATEQGIIQIDKSKFYSKNFS